MNHKKACCQSCFLFFAALFATQKPRHPTQSHGGILLEHACIKFLTLFENSIHAVLRLNTTFYRDRPCLRWVFQSQHAFSCRSLSVTYSSEASVTRRHLRCHVTLYQTTNLALEFQPLRSPIRTYAQTSFDAVVLMDTRKAYTQFAIPCCLIMKDKIDGCNLYSYKPRKHNVRTNYWNRCKSFLVY